MGGSNRSGTPRSSEGGGIGETSGEGAFNGADSGGGASVTPPNPPNPLNPPTYSSGASGRSRGDLSSNSDLMPMNRAAPSGDRGNVDADVSRLLGGAAGLKDALELARFAVAALQEDSAGEARQYLRASLSALD